MQALASTNGKASQFLANNGDDEHQLSFDEKVFRLARRGWRHEAIAREVNCCRKTVHNSLKRSAARYAEELSAEEPLTVVGEEVAKLRHQLQRCELFLEHLIASGKLNPDSGKREWSSKQIERIQAQERLVANVSQQIIDLLFRCRLIPEEARKLTQPLKTPDDQPRRGDLIERSEDELRAMLEKLIRSTGKLSR